MTAESAEALSSLRSADHFEWYTVNLIAFVVYIYARAVQRKEWEKVTLALGFWAVEFLWEMLNALILRFSGHAPLWIVGKKSVLLIYVGLNLEIALMFGVLPLVLLDLLPADRTARIWRVPNRLFVPVVLGLFCVGVEILLWRWGALVWTWWWWKLPHVWLIAISYCGPLAALVWIHDHVSARRKFQGMLVAMAAAAAAHLLLVHGLRWI
ncbi:MAG: hypothetical protein R3B70_13365 [Polyangiaceae bacterium]